jgi:hypothetical protein
MRKLGLLPDDAAPSAEAVEAYHKLFELSLTDDMIEVISQLYGWSLSLIKGCGMPPPEISGGRLMVA